MIYHSSKKEEGQNEHSAEKQPDTIQPLTLTRQRYKMGVDTPKNKSAFSTQPYIYIFQISSRSLAHF